MKKLVVTVLVLGLLGGGGYWYYRYSQKPEAPTVTTAAVTRGDVFETVGATGTLAAVTTVQVGTQVSGTIQALYADFNSLVRKGQVLARLDPSLFQTQIEQARANLIRAQADLERLRVTLADAQTKLNRARELSNRQLIPRTDLETAEVNVRSAEAQIRSQEAQVTQAQASLNQNQVNLEHTVITAPIDGLVISRNVDVGQTVAASMQAPTLFVLAADLTKMQVVANLDESDVGRIRPNQAVVFRVDAYPNDTFRGSVSQVRLEAKVQQNVVTYATVIDVPNDDLRLKPGMTANVNIELAKALNVLRVPNAALRFRPAAEVFTALGQAPPEPQGRGFAPGGGRRNGSQGNGDTPGTPASASPAPAVAPGSQAPTVTTPGRAEPAAQVEAGSGARPPARGAAPGQGDGRGGSTAPTGGDRQPEAAADTTDRRARFAERMQNLPPEQREAMMARMRERGIDPANPGAAFNGRGGVGERNSATGSTDAPSGQGRGRRDSPAPASPPAGAQSPGTIDALFAPLPRTESPGRVWTYVNNTLQPVRLRLGISDGQFTELIEGDLSEGADVVTNVVLPGQTTRPATTAFPGFGPQGGRQGFPGGGFNGGGGRGR